MGSPYIQCRDAQITVEMYNDAGSKARMDLAVGIPDIPDSWFVLGQTAFPNSHIVGDVAGVISKGLLVKELVSGSLVPIADWELIWTWDPSNSRGNDFRLWRGIVQDPTNYVVLGDFFKCGSEKPSEEETSKFRAICKSAVEEYNGANLPAATQIWDDAGSGAPDDASVWRVNPFDDETGALLGDTTGTLNPSLFKASGNHNVPQRTCYYLAEGAYTYEEDDDD